MKLKDLVLGLIVLLIIYLVYIWFFTDSTKIYMLTGANDALTGTTINNADIPKKLTHDFTYAFWIYVDEWSEGLEKNKVIIRRPSASGEDSIKIFLTPHVNNMQFNLGTMDSAPNTPGNFNCKLNNIPLQRWVNIILTVNNRAADIYLDGKLVNTCIATSVLKEDSATNIDICKADTSTTVEDMSGFRGSISNVIYYTRTINPREAYSIYREGPGSGNALLNLLNKYRLKLAFMSQGKEVKSFEI